MTHHLLPNTLAAYSEKKRANLALLLTRYGRPGLESKDAKPEMEALLDRWDQSLASRGAQAVRERAEAAAKRDFAFYGVITGTTIWRAVSGMADASVFETTVTLHPLCGFPHFRGSALKGLTRAYATVWQGEERRQVERVFGSGGDDEHPGIGSVHFLGGFPANEEAARALEVDIMNPHYRDYYEKGLPPVDWSSPVPVYFLAIKPNVKFTFIAGGDDIDCLRAAAQWMKGALENIGIGAKTASGYGYFCIEATKLIRSDGSWTETLS